MRELITGLAFLGVSALCAYIGISKRARAFIRKHHLPSQTEDGWMGWIVFSLVAGMTSFLVGIALAVHSIFKMLR
jgi:hypothetical protein